MARHKYKTLRLKCHRPGGWLTTLAGLAAAVLLYGTAALAGADFIVVGRPVLEARDPARAAQAILEEIA